jgi:hypothetical protein
MRGRQSRFNYLLALVALCLQLAAPVLLTPQVSFAGQDEFAEFLRLHALCLGGDPAQDRPAAPGQDRSDRTGHHAGACCFLHGSPSSALVPPSTVQPVAIGFSEVLFPAPTTREVVARPVTSPRARSPPSEA